MYMADISSEVKNIEELGLKTWEEEGAVIPTKDFVSPEQLYQKLVASVRKYHPSTDISLIEKAYRIAEKAHEGQVRKSGEPYIIHPLCVSIFSQIWRWIRRRSLRGFSMMSWRIRS